VGRDFLGLAMSFEQPKLQSEFKKTTIFHYTYKKERKKKKKQRTFLYGRQVKNAKN
jgi:hypothetical protein